jgi:CBS domain-containing protein
MQVREIMTREVEVVVPDAPVREAAETMRVLDVGPLPVCDGDRLVGMLTDRDITIRAVAEGRDPNSTTVREVMTADLVYAFEDQDVAEIERMMRDAQIRRLVVLDRDKRLTGIVSLGDVAVDTANTRQTGETLKEVSRPS